MRNLFLSLFFSLKSANIFESKITLQKNIPEDEEEYFFFFFSKTTIQLFFTNREFIDN